MNDVNHVMCSAPDIYNLLPAKCRFLAREYIASFFDIGWYYVFVGILSSSSAKVNVVLLGSH
jgi:hypothetical protein